MKYYVIEIVPLFKMLLLVSHPLLTFLSILNFCQASKVGVEMVQPWYRDCPTSQTRPGIPLLGEDQRTKATHPRSPAWRLPVLGLPHPQLCILSPMGQRDRGAMRENEGASRNTGEEPCR